MAHQRHEVSFPIIEEQLQEVELPISDIQVLSTIPHFSCDSCCPFSNLEHDSEQRSESTTKLCGLMVFYLIVMMVEIVGGLKANSLAILADAAHLLTDVAGFSISLFTVRASGWDATARQSFGFNRIEVLGAAISVQLIWIISVYLIVEALNRIILKHAEVNGGLMFGIAAFGFVINFIMVMWLGHDHHGHGHGHGHFHSHGHGHGHGHSHGHGHDHEHGHGHSHDTCLEKGHVHEKDEDEEEEENTNLVSASTDKGKTMNINVEGAYLHVMVDMIQSVGVMIAGLVIWAKPNWLIVDLVCTLVFSVLALATTVPMLKSIFCILMESTPVEIDVVNLETDLKKIVGLLDVHDLHVWAITVGKFVLACHVKVDHTVNPNAILYKVRELCQTAHGINHVTVQIEHV